jgi:Na+-transporting NADH:ubiquinone oxidoreductase subunit C
MLAKDSIANTFLVSLALCVVCSLVVSAAAVNLRDLQKSNKDLDIRKNVLIVAGLGTDVEINRMSRTELSDLFEKRVDEKLVDLSSGDYVENPEPSYDPRKAAKDPGQRVPVEGSFPIGAGYREPKARVFLIKDESGKANRVVLPIYGMGLWSTLYGFVAVEKDLRTVAGLTYYQHAETPGLGGEVENPGWKSKWPGKKVWATGAEPSNENLKIGVAKGAPTPENLPYQVDGLSGATITSRGVDSMLKYWFSQEGFGPYLKKLATELGGTNEQ